jgi:hypothetical protein
MKHKISPANHMMIYWDLPSVKLFRENDAGLCSLIKRNYSVIIRNSLQLIRVMLTFQVFKKYLPNYSLCRILNKV